jgi:hypothetical protein
LRKIVPDFNAGDMDLVNKYMPVVKAECHEAGRRLKQVVLAKFRIKNQMSAAYNFFGVQYLSAEDKYWYLRMYHFYMISKINNRWLSAERDMNKSKSTSPSFETFAAVIRTAKVKQGIVSFANDLNVVYDRDAMADLVAGQARL